MTFVENDGYDGYDGFYTFTHEKKKKIYIKNRVPVKLVIPVMVHIHPTAYYNRKDTKL